MTFVIRIDVDVKALRLAPVFQAIVASVAACSETPDTTDASAIDASSGEAAADVAVIADAGADVPLDSYVAWCEAGPPRLLADAGCFSYYDVPCGVPPGDTVDEAGTINRCDQICAGAPDDQCAVLPQPWIDVFLDAGLIDAATAATVEAGAVFVMCACQGSAGRRPAGFREPTVRRAHPLGDWFAYVACLERASVVAFSRMGAELRALGAPASLVRRAARAMRDEQRHTRAMSRLSKRFGGRVPRGRVARRRKRAVEAIALENAVEGCVRETFGALVATWQAANARDAEVRAAFATIARDETRHAELSHAVARFLDSKLDDDARARVARAAREAFTRLERDAARSVHPALVSVAGLPSAATTRRLLAALWGEAPRIQGFDARARFG